MPYDPERHGPRRVVGPGFRRRVEAVIATVPPGRVTTYGCVARALGLPRAARHVGFALASLPGDTDVPWHRVVNARGRISPRADGAPSPAQARLLMAEGVGVDASGSVRDFGRRRFAPAAVDAATT